MGNSSAREKVCDNYDHGTINRGTQNRPKPLLKFHSVHGDNVILSKDNLIAKRNDSFCKALVFSNRPISINEIVCLRFCEVGTNWSGVLRFGVTNTDPATFRDIELPKFVCPDLTSKAGFWAKALAERYSIDKGILHFYINSSGELHYGINGVNKGLFLNKINVSLPLWIVMDIYGNSIGIEFVDPANINFINLINQKKSLKPDLNKNYLTSDNLIETNSNLSNQDQLPLPKTSLSQTSRMRFHTVKGANITLENDELIAVRKKNEYFLGYVFTERPIQINEKLKIIVLETEELFSGSLAFGFTSCDPISIPASRLPVDSDELLERPEYWVCIKDVAVQPVAGDKLTFFFDSNGRVFFTKNDAAPRIIMHVDVSVNLWAFFDLYGTTVKIQLLDSFNDSDIKNLENNNNQIKSSNFSYNEKFNKLLTSNCLDLDQLRVALPNYDNNLPSTSSTRLPSLPTSSESKLDNRLENASSSSSSNSITSESFGLSRNYPTLNSKRYNIGSELYDNRSTYLSPVLNSNFDGLALRYSNLLSKKRSNALNNNFFPYNHKNSNTLKNYQTYLLPNFYSTEQRFNSSRNTGILKTPDTSNSILQNSTNNEDFKTNNNANNECSICMNNKVNSVIYRCGHMCMCYECAKETQRRCGDCPICRTQIIDVIRCYPS